MLMNFTTSPRKEFVAILLLRTAKGRELLTPPRPGTRQIGRLRPECGPGLPQLRQGVGRPEHGYHDSDRSQDNRDDQRAYLGRHRLGGGVEHVSYPAASAEYRPRQQPGEYAECSP